MYLFFRLFVAMLVANWNIVNISNIEVKSISVTWTPYTPGNQDELILYAVVCTPTHGKAGPTILSVDRDSDRADVGRLRAGTNYTVHVVALTKHHVSGEMSLKRSQEAYAGTIEGGKTFKYHQTVRSC